MFPTTVKSPLESNFILLVPPVAKYNTPDDSVTVQLPRSTVVAFKVVKVGLPDNEAAAKPVRDEPSPENEVAVKAPPAVIFSPFRSNPLVNEIATEYK